MKKYSFPCVSPALRSLVVAETEYTISGLRLRSSAQRVPLPEPDGPETTSRSPV